MKKQKAAAGGSNDTAITWDEHGNQVDVPNDPGPMGGLVQGCLRNHSGATRDPKFEGKRAVLRIYGF